MLQNFHRRIAEKSSDTHARTVIIAALGDSVTAGATAEGEYLHDKVYHAQLQRLLEKRYPQCLFSTVNAGINGMNTAGGLQFLERDVLPLQPDLLLIAFGLNDVSGGLEMLDDYKAALQKLVSTARVAGIADIILLTPNFMPTRATDKIPAKWQHLTERFIALQTGGTLAAYAAAMREVGASHNVSVADVYAAWEALERGGTDTTSWLANGLNHPDARGHQLAAQNVFDVITQQEGDFSES